MNLHTAVITFDDEKEDRREKADDGAIRLSMIASRDKGRVLQVRTKRKIVRPRKRANRLAFEYVG